jgi:hypothetical protein
MKSQGLQENQQVVFLSDGGEDVRRVQAYLQPGSEHWIDWFHITMRLTVLQQQTKSLQGEAGQQETGAAVSKQLESVKHLLWHGNVEASGEAGCLAAGTGIDSGAFRGCGQTAAGPNWRPVWPSSESIFPTTRSSSRTFGERYRQGETISTAFVESTINQVVSRRFVKKQQMHWTLRGAHLLLQTRTKVLNNELEEVFRRWYPEFRAKAAWPPTLCCTPKSSAFPVEPEIMDDKERAIDEFASHHP